VRILGCEEREGEKRRCSSNTILWIGKGDRFEKI
jgi:hypothetical protein